MKTTKTIILILSLFVTVSLRAVTEILLEDGFEVDDTNGTEFFATVNGSCYNSY